MHDKLPHFRRARQQAAKTFGPLAVERALTCGRCGEAGFKIRFDGGQDARIDRPPERAPPIAREQAQRAWHDLYGLQLRITKLFDDSGVPMLSGSDESGSWEVPGFALHQEFDQLARAGVPPLHILQMTTINGARFFGWPDFGRVMPGAPADLVLLDANPLASANNLHRIAGVMRAGYFYPRADLDAMLCDVAKHDGRFVQPSK